ncbi:MAG TPA: redoxin domain-containing protein [Bacillales bacterium]|nr:redoxin domain-containing protein [Bacillales bacterium]
MKHLQDLEASLERFERFNVHITGISTDDISDLKDVVKENELSYPVLSDSDFEVSESYDVPIHQDDELYEDHGKHNDPAYFLVNEKGQIMYWDKQTGPFGRPSAEELTQTIKYVQKQAK